jgi:hypothetical protein
MEPSPPPQRTVLGILALVLCPVPVVGLVVAIMVLRRCKVGTWGNTISQIATFLAGLMSLFWIFAIYAVVRLKLYGLDG